MEFIDGLFYILVLIISVVIHEFAHGYTAYLLGDDTARLSGRLTLNPIKHLDPIGSVILPLFLVITKAGFLIGWARPVPYNPRNFRNVKKGTLLVAVSGILANISIAVIFGLLIRFAPVLGFPAYSLDASVLNPFYKIATMIVFLNIVLALFNLIPIPPLDGSKVLFSLLPAKYFQVENFLNRWGFLILLFFIMFVWQAFVPLIFGIFSLITGI